MAETQQIRNAIRDIISECRFKENCEYKIMVSDIEEYLNQHYPVKEKDGTNEK